MTLQHGHPGSVLLAQLTREQRAGLFVWPSLAGPELTDTERQLLVRYKPSGVVLFRRSMTSLLQTRKLCSEIHKLTSAPHQKEGAVIALDEEGGRVYRLPPPFPRNDPAASFAPIERENDLRSQVLLQAAAARAVGVDCLLAPVVDVLTRPDNPAIGDRSFSSAAETVARCAQAVVEEIHAGGLFSCAKHFPGHGHTATDSHKGFATTDVPLATLRSREWFPFAELITKANLQFIMTAHVVCSDLDSLRPATLSPKILKQYLREELGFKGLILSDDLRMNAISDYYGVEKAITAAIVDEGQTSHDVSDDSFLRKASCDALEAGCDVLLSCQSIEREVTVLEAVAQFLESRLESNEWAEKVERVVTHTKKRTQIL
jgi:beta-N-acetylhexosaminidase